MTAQEAPVECTHELCNCTVSGSIEGGESYCSDYCRRVTDDGIESESCNCGHPQCDVP